MARDREEALTKNDMFWQKRINQIEVANNRSAQVLEKEYSQSVSKSIELINLIAVGRLKVIHQSILWNIQNVTASFD